MAILNINQRKIVKRRRDGQIVGGGAVSTSVVTGGGGSNGGSSFDPTILQDYVKQYELSQEILKNNNKLKGWFISKTEADTAKEHITFEKGITSKSVTSETVTTDDAIADNITIKSQIKSEVFNSGMLGEGFMLKKNAIGNWDLELDNLVVRKNMDVFKLTIQEVKSVGGQLLLSPASMKCTKVTELANVYRCYFNNDSGNISNPFEVGDQALCQQFNGKGAKRYWRLVTFVGSDYIELSKTDKDGSGIPAKDDEIVQLGNRTNTERQSAILISSYGIPKIEQFKGINSFSTVGKLVTRISPDGNLFRAVDFIVETADGSGYLKMQDNQLYVKANVTFASGSPAIQQTEDIAKDLVDSVDVGNRNYLIDSDRYIYAPFGSDYKHLDCEITDLQDLRGKEITLSFDYEKTSNYKEGNGVTGFYARVFYIDGTTQDLNDRFAVTNATKLKGRISSVFQIKDKEIERLGSIVSYFNFGLHAIGGNGQDRLGEVEVGRPALQIGNKSGGWSSAPEDLQKEIDDKIAITKAESQQAWEAFATAKADLAKTEAIANADGKITAEEQARIDADNAKLQAAKEYADAKDAKKETILKAYADNKITESEQAAIDAAKAYSDLKDVEVKAYADGKIDEEEQRAIADAQSKFEAAKAHAQELADAIDVGSRNYLLESDRYIYAPFGSGYKHLDCEIIDLKDLRGKEIILSFDYEKTADYDEGNGVTGFYARVFYIDGTTQDLNDRFSVTNAKKLKGRISNVFHLKDKEISKIGSIVSYFNFGLHALGGNGQDRLGEVKIGRPALQVGNKSGGWSSAPEDLQKEIDDKVNAAKTDLENQIAIAKAEAANAQQTADRLAEKTDFISDTKINGNTVATGTLQVGNSQGANAGITGVGTGSAVRFYAGADFNNRNNAPFRVTDDGRMVANNANIEGKITTDDITATSGYIGMFKLENGALVSVDENGQQNKWAAVIMRDNDNNREVLTGTNVFSGITGINGLQYIKNTNTSRWSLGVYYDVPNGNAVHAHTGNIVAVDGNIMGRKIFEEETLNNTNFYHIPIDDYILSCDTSFVLKCIGPGYSNFYLPNNVKEGTVYDVVCHSLSTRNLYIRPQNGDNYYAANGGGPQDYSKLDNGEYEKVIKVSDGWQAYGWSAR